MLADDLLDTAKIRSITPEQVRRSLPLEWVLGRLWNLWGVGARKEHCPNPLHSDSTPSFNLWAPNEDGVYQKFGCYGCGIRGDVIDAIRLYYGCSFPDALDHAIDLIEEFSASGFVPGSDPRPPATLEEVRAEYEGILGEGVDMAVYWRFLNSKIMSHLHLYPHEQWGWFGNKARNAVVFPHFSPNGSFMGAKLRDKLNGSKWGVRGSKFEWLYGAWRDRDYDTLLICEGETDTVYADWYLKDEEISVLGAPTAYANPTPMMETQIRHRDVVLAFDGDEAGDRAVGVWLRAIPWARVYEIPRGLDLMTSRIPPLTIVEDAK